MNGLPLHVLRPLYLAAAVGVLLMTGILWAVRGEAGSPSSLGPLLGDAAAALLLAAVGAVQVLRARLLAVLREDASALAALQANQVPRRALPLLVLPLALLETPSLLAATGLFHHGPTWLLALPALSAATLVWALPTQGNLLHALNA
jgi:hypothetical protein